MLPDQEWNRCGTQLIYDLQKMILDNLTDCPSLSPRPLASPSYPQSHPSLIMDLELLPIVSLLPETFSVLIAPLELLTGALNSHLDLQRYKILYVCGN